MRIPARGKARTARPEPAVNSRGNIDPARECGSKKATEPCDVVPRLREYLPSFLPHPESPGGSADHARRRKMGKCRCAGGITLYDEPRTSFTLQG